MDEGWVVTQDGVRLPTRWWRGGREDGRPAVVVVHGFAAHRHDPTVVAVSSAIADAGFDVLTYDARGHGQAGGLCTLGDLERLDVAAVVARAAVDHDRVSLVGASMGAIAALRYAASDDPRAASLIGVVSVSSPAAWRAPRTPQVALTAALTQTSTGRALARRYLNVRLRPGWSRPESPVELVGRIGVPLVVVHGRDDRFIRRHDAATLAENATGPVLLDVVDQMGHAYHPMSHGPIARGLRWCGDGDGDLRPTGRPAST